MKLEIKTSSTGTPNQYDLYYTATGRYVSISEFITAVENDSSLGFKIENFKLLPTVNEQTQDTVTLQATFVTKDIAINLEKLATQSQNTNPTNNTQNNSNTQNSNDTKQNNSNTLDNDKNAEGNKENQ